MPCNPGTINIYYKRNSSSAANLPSGGFGGGLLFLGDTRATRSFSVSLDASDFDSTGGILYAEYKTSSGIVYKSGNISIVKNSTPPPTTTPPPPPTTTPPPPVTTPVFEITSVFWGQSPQLLPLNQNQRWVEIKIIFINIGLLQIPVPQTKDYVLGPIFDNIFLQVATTLPDGTTIIEPNKYMNIIVVRPSSNITNSTAKKYTTEIQKDGVDNGGLMFENAESNPLSVNVQNVLPIENNITWVAQVATLCCNQTITPNSIINPIIDGANPNFYIETCNWELSSDGNVWSKIDNSTSKNYQPLQKDFLDNNGSFESRFFRKIQKCQSDDGIEKYFVSNVVKITVNNTNRKNVGKLSQNDYDDSSIIVYPNPSSSFVKIEGKADLSTSKLKIIDLSGKNWSYETPIISDDKKSLRINISLFPVGVYTLIIDNLGDIITKKIIKE